MKEKSKKRYDLLKRQDGPIQNFAGNLLVEVVAAATISSVAVSTCVVVRHGCSTLQCGCVRTVRQALVGSMTSSRLRHVELQVVE